MIQLSEFFQYAFVLILKRKCLVGASRVRCRESGTHSTIIYTRWSSRRYELGCDAPVVTTCKSPKAFLTVLFEKNPTMTDGLPQKNWKVFSYVVIMLVSLFLLPRELMGIPFNRFAVIFSVWYRSAGANPFLTDRSWSSDSNAGHNSGRRKVSLRFWDSCTELGADLRCNSLMVGIYPAARAQRHVLVFPPYQNNTHIYIYIQS